MGDFKMIAVGPQHAEILADLSRETFLEAFAPFNTPENMHKFMEEQFTRAQLMEEVGREGLCFTLAFAGDTPAGYIKTRLWQDHPVIGEGPLLEISRIYSRKQYWGSGLGRLLMQEALGQAKVLALRRVWLGVWEQNPRAIRFYEKWGFKKVGEHDFLLGEDPQRDWLMLRNE